MNLQEIERLAFLKYRLSGKKTMNTFVFSQVKKHKLTDKQIEILLDNLEKRIDNYINNELKQVNFTCNL